MKCFSVVVFSIWMFTGCRTTNEAAPSSEESSQDVLSNSVYKEIPLTVSTCKHGFKKGKTYRIYSPYGYKIRSSRYGRIPWTDHKSSDFKFTPKHSGKHCFELYKTPFG